MNNCLFSIIVPIYNVEKYIVKCIESILLQSFKNFELILVDDGSPDHCGEICDMYAEKDNRISVIHKKNGGLSSARNSGLKQAHGQYVMFVDSDDWLLPDALEEISNGCKSFPDLVVFNFQYHYENDSIAISSSLPKKDTETAEEYMQDVAQYKLFDNLIACNKVYRRELLKDNSIQFIEGILHEDGPFFHTTLSFAETVVFVDKPLYSYRKGRPDAITSNSTYRNFESLIKGIEYAKAIRAHSRQFSRDRNFVMLNTLVFAIIQNYNTAEDVDKVIRASSSVHIKKLLLSLLLSRFDVKISIIGLAAYIYPRLARYLVRVKN